MWGWKRRLLARVAPKLDATSVLRARARLRAAAKAKVTAEKVAARKRKQEVDAEYAKVRKKTVHRRELGSVSDLLTNVLASISFVMTLSHSLCTPPGPIIQSTIQVIPA